MAQHQAYAGSLVYVEFDGVEISETAMEEFVENVGEVAAATTHLKSDIDTPSGLKIRDTVEPTARVRLDGSATGLAIRAVLKHGNVANLIWGNLGNGNGQPKYGIIARCVITKTVNLTDAQMMDVTFVPVGDTWLFNYDIDDDTF